MPNHSTRPIVLWLATVCVLIIAMVGVGGITRLTGSGLSIVDWKPIMGAIPPLSPEAWQEAFEKYQQFPQYKLINQGMSLAQFKSIFFWEYFHRLLGRLIGLVFFIPWIYFLVRKRLDRDLSIKLAIGFVLGGLQGALGWFMVKSGLVDQPSVSHYRLAAHLSLALLVLAYLLWILLDLVAIPRPQTPDAAKLRRPLRWISIGIIVQVIYGAFTAGMKAGFAYNTFPTMNGEWVPSNVLTLQPAWLNLIDNSTTVQFIHRMIAWILVVMIGAFWFYSRRLKLDRSLIMGLNGLMAITLGQFLLGVATILLVVPVSVATIHQLGACLLFCVMIWLNHALKR